MKRTTLIALEGSIDKWAKIVTGKGIDDGVDNCPLCALYYENRSYDDQCKGCPVYEKTGVRFCKETPYDNWVITYRIEMNKLTCEDAHPYQVIGPRTNAHPYQVIGPCTMQAAIDEYDFLYNLLP